jgi:hypothetical protein
MGGCDEIDNLTRQQARLDGEYDFSGFEQHEAEGPYKVLYPYLLDTLLAT